VKNQSGEEIVELIKKHVNKNLPAGATVTFKQNGGVASAMKFPSDTRAFIYVSDALAKIYGKEPLQVAAGYTVGPLIDIKEILGLYAYSLGFEQADEKWHSSNEFFRVSNLKRGQLIYCYYLQHLAEEEGKLKN
jgi:acetylornithine deacetylase/succinyl-diaminopimelate desuccinylase-like protein